MRSHYGEKQKQKFAGKMPHIPVVLFMLSYLKAANKVNKSETNKLQQNITQEYCFDAEPYFVTVYNFILLIFT